MYTIQYLFRQHPQSPNKTFSGIYACLSLFFAIYSGINFSLNDTWLHGLVISLLCLFLSSIYWLGIQFWAIDKKINQQLKEEGLNYTSIYSLESASSCDNIFVDTISISHDFNKKAILLSSMPMNQLESICESANMGEYYCNINDIQSQEYICRRVAMNKIVVVAFDQYPNQGPLNDADCVLIPYGQDSFGSPACVFFDSSKYTSSAEACHRYINLANKFMPVIGNFYANNALRCLIALLLISMFSILPIGFMAMICILTSAILSLYIIALKAVRNLELTENK